MYLTPDQHEFFEYEFEPVYRPQFELKPAFSRAIVKKTFHEFRTVVLSDTHLGKSAASAGFLLEFLQNVKCKRLTLNGDIIDGWDLDSEKRKEFPEMHKRCLDALLERAASGTEVIYLRGNHDEKLAKSKYDLVSRTIIFKDKKSGIKAPIHFAKSFVHEDGAGLKWLVLHGDVFDSWQKDQDKKKIAQYVDGLYEHFVNLSNAFRSATLNLTGRSVSLAANAKIWTKKWVGVIDAFETSVAKDSIRERYDGVICGHIHHADITENNGRRYMNSGDFVEGCSCIAEDENGNWEILHWSQERKQLGLRKPPGVSDENRNREFRDLTDRIIDAGIRRVWPGKDRSGYLAEIRRQPKNCQVREAAI